MPEFPIQGPITLVAKLPAGSLQIAADPEAKVATVVVEPYEPQDQPAADNTRVEMHGDTLHVEAPNTGRAWGLRRTSRLWVKITLPADSYVQAAVSSAELTCTGRLSGADLRTSSGNCALEEFTGPVSVGTASGDVRVGTAGGGLKARGASSNITVGSAAGDTNLRTASGDVKVRRAEGVVHASTASGNVELAEVGAGEVEVHTASGDVSIGVLAGTGVWLDLNTVSGRTASDLTVGGVAPAGGGPDLTLQVRTVSGNIALHRIGIPTNA